jgi:hypothetical protein
LAAPSIILEKTVGPRKKVQDFESESLDGVAEQLERFVQIMNAPLSGNNVLEKAFEDFKKKYG